MDVGKWNWSELVPYVIHAYNVTPPTDLENVSPFYLMYGREPNLKLDVENGIKSPNQLNRVEQITNLQEILQDLPKIIEINQEKMKTKFDSKIKNCDLKEGDKVLVIKPSKE